MKPWTEKAKAAFWSKVDRRGIDQCWPWLKSTTGTGYGQVNMGTHAKAMHAHLVAYQLVKGPLRAGEVVMHSCDNRLCCNPRHLTQGTQGDNVRDAYRKGRLVTPQANTAEEKRRASVYPRLVEALRYEVLGHGAAVDSRTLLRELGEE